MLTYNNNNNNNMRSMDSELKYQGTSAVELNLTFELTLILL